MKTTNARLIKTLLAVGLLGLCAPLVHAVKVFPGAAGFGTDTVAGRGPGGGTTPTIYVVDKLTDSATPVQGELRHGVETVSGPRIIVFKVAGTIELTRVLRIRNNRRYLTIAGQTAPPPGITLKNAGIDVQARDVLIQHIAIRPGTRRNNVAPYTGLQGFGNRKGILVNPTVDAGQLVNNVVFDHVSVSWGTDENVTFDANNNPVYDITFSNSLNYEAIRLGGVTGLLVNGAYEGHPDVYNIDTKNTATTADDEVVKVGAGIDGHSAGFYIYNGTRRVSVARNIFAFNRWRNPLLAGNSENGSEAGAFPTNVRIANNFIYAPGENNGHRIDIGTKDNDAAPAGGDQNTTTVSIVGNVVYHNASYTIYPSFASTTKYSAPATNAIRTLGGTPGAPSTINAFFADNRLHAASGWVSSTPYAAPILSEGRAVTPQSPDPVGDGVSLLSYGSEQQFQDLLTNQAGSRPLVRDLHDRRIIKQIKERKDRDWTDFPSQSLTTPSFATDIDVAELDADGYPTATGFHDINLSLSAVTNPHGDTDSDGWTNVEEWIHAWSKFVEATPSGTLSAETPKLDNFEDGTLSDWTTSGGAWALATIGTADTPEHNLVYAQTNNATTARAVLGGTNWAYQTVQAEMTPTSLGAAYAFGVLGRYRDGSNYYHLVLRNGGVFELRRVVGGGSPTVLASASGYSVATGGTYRFRLVLDGPQIVGTVSTWNATTFTWSTPVQIVGFDSDPIANGSAGLGMTNAATQSNCVLASPSIEERDLFAEDFQSGTSHWTSAATSAWSVVSDGGSLVYRQTNTSLGAATFNDMVADDQTIETQLRFLSTADNADRWVGLMARYQDENNYYYTALRYSGSGNANNRIEVKKIVAGSAMELDRAYIPVSVPGTYATRFEVVGSTLNVYLGQRRVLETQDTALTSGRQGVRMYKASAQFDDFTVTRLNN